MGVLTEVHAHRALATHLGDSNIRYRLHRLIVDRRRAKHLLVAPVQGRIPITHRSRNREIYRNRLIRILSANNNLNR